MRMLIRIYIQICIFVRFCLKDFILSVICWQLNLAVFYGIKDAIIICSRESLLTF